MTKKAVRSVCPYCGVGCGVVMEVEAGKIKKVSGDKRHPTNFGRLCTKGATCAEPISSPGRVTKPYIARPDGSDEVLSMDQAIARVARDLRAIIDADGPDAVALYVSGQMSLEAQYLANKLCKGFIGTNNIESNSRLCMASAGSGYKLSLGSDGPPGSYQDFDKADLFFVIGANMADCHPILFLRMMDRLKAGAKLIVVDPRRNATADKADLYLPIRPGADLALLNGLLHLLVEAGKTDPAFIESFTRGWEAMPAFLEDYAPARVAELTDLPEADIRKAAEWIGSAAAFMSCWTMGLNQSTHGTWNANAICNLHLATGKICRPGSGPFSLTGQPNAMGGREMGYMGPGLPGQRSVLDAKERAFVEQVWGAPSGTLRAEAGAGTIAMFEAMAAHRIKACWIICTNPVASVANRRTVIAGLEACDLVVAQDAYLETETNAYADIILPGALWAEAEGVMVNSERNLTLMEKAVEPPGEALPDWRIIARVACEMGYAHAFAYQSASDVFDEIRRFWNPKTGYDIRGASHARLAQAPLQWPIGPDAAGDRNPIRYLNDGGSQAERLGPDGVRPKIAFATEDGKAVFLPRPHMAPAEMPDAEFPFVLNTGRLQHQWHTLTKTGRVPALMKLDPGPFVDLNPEDAKALGVANGDRVEVRSRRGKAVLPAAVTDRVRPGHCFAPFHWNDTFGDDLAINAVTSDAIDPISLQPEFKFCAVALARVGGPVEALPPTALEPPTPVAAAKRAVAAGAQTTEAVAGERSSVAMLERTQVVSMTRQPAVELFAQLVGVKSGVVPPLDADDNVYIEGFLMGLRSDGPTPTAVPMLPETAPLDPQKRHYLNGLLAGLFSRAPLADGVPLQSGANALPVGVSAPALAAASQRVGRDILLLWASQTGATEEKAKDLARTLQAAGHSTRLVCMESASIADLVGASIVLVAASTFGDGDPPDNGSSFWKALSDPAAPMLASLQFAVIAFGDSSYGQFCGFGRKLDTRLAELGCRRIVDRADCEPDDEDTPGDWLGHVLSGLGDGVTIAQAPASPPPAPLARPFAGFAVPRDVSEEASAKPAPDSKTYSRKDPLLTRLKRNRLLSGAGAGKEVRQFGFDLAGSGVAYRAGDALGVWPTNCPELVIELLDLLDLTGSEIVTLKNKGEMRLADALRRHLEITRITRDFLELVDRVSNGAPFSALLAEERKGDLQQWSWRRQIVDVLHDAPIRIDAQSFASAMKPLQPRLYSISSSALATADEVQLTVSTVRYDSSWGRRKGACSTFLADRAEDAVVPIFLQRAPHFHPPDDLSAPMIMVGPGTGVAPFRAFLQERRAAGATGDNWLFFGEQHAASDFYYRDEITGWRCDGHLSRLDLAFSRDDEEKIYVQHRMLERGAELWRWLDLGAYFYVCGDADRMAKDVDVVLRMVVSQHSGLGEAEAAAYVDRMAQDKRYLRDVY